MEIQTENKTLIPKGTNLVDMIKEAISQVYAPAHDTRTADELLKPVDMFEAMAQHAEISREDALYLARELGFKFTNIDGQTYIPVNYP